MFFPENWCRFVNYIPEEERSDLLAAYHRRLTDPSPAVHLPAAVVWKSYEMTCTTLRSTGTAVLEDSPHTLAMSRIMAHYLTHRALLEEGALIEGAERLCHVPGYIVQGRYDMICPPRYADQLAPAWPGASFEIVPDAGHSAFESDTVSRLVHAGQMLLDWLGYEVVATTHSHEALEIFRASPQDFDLVITDQTMPQMTGDQLARAMRQVRADISIILCTGFSQTMGPEQAQAAQIEAFMMKPFTLRELGETVQRILSENRG